MLRDQFGPDYDEDAEARRWYVWAMVLLIIAVGAFGFAWVMGAPAVQVPTAQGRAEEGR